jgi:retron-type reverse transcriptase
MNSWGFNLNLITTLESYLTGRKVQYDGELIETELGTPQGSCLSPILWNIYVSDLCKELENMPTSKQRKIDEMLPINKNNLRIKTEPIKKEAKRMKTLFYADDSTTLNNYDDQLKRSWEIYKKWSSRNGIEINTNKSQVLQLKADQRTKDISEEEYRQILPDGPPLVKN